METLECLVEDHEDETKTKITNVQKNKNKMEIKSGKMDNLGFSLALVICRVEC